MLALLLLYLVSLQNLNAELPTISARSLDALLQNYAFKSLVKPVTGTPYDGRVPPNLTGIEISALRLRSGSLRARGLEGYKEFEIPTGVLVHPYVERLVLVYQNLGKFSSLYYPLPGYTYLTPIVGLLAYSGSNLSALNLPDLDIQALGDPILVKFSNVKTIVEATSPKTLQPKCVYFDLHGTVQFDKLLEGNACPTVQQGHFAIVVESIISPAPAPGAEGHGGGGGRQKGVDKGVWVIAVSCVGGILVLVVLVLCVMLVWKKLKEKKMKEMVKAAEGSEVLRSTSIGSVRAPLALGTRTKPELESGYVP